MTGFPSCPSWAKRFDRASELTATPLSGVQIFQLKSADKCQESAGFKRVFPRKDLGHTRLRDPESSSQILLGVATHRLREVP